MISRWAWGLESEQSLSGPGTPDRSGGLPLSGSHGARGAVLCRSRPGGWQPRMDMHQVVEQLRDRRPEIGASLDWLYRFFAGYLEDEAWIFVSSKTTLPRPRGLLWDKDWQSPLVAIM